jgi:hypothetical protein
MLLFLEYLNLIKWTIYGFSEYRTERTALFKADVNRITYKYLESKIIISIPKDLFVAKNF